MEISLKQIEFPVEIREKLTTWTNTSKTTLTFITGREIRLKQTNLVVESPPKVIFKNNNQIITAYYENDCFYLNNEKVSFNKLIKLANNK